MKHTFFFLTAIFFLTTENSSLAQNSATDGLMKYHQFDFWLGHWDVYNTGSDQLVAQSFIESIADSLGFLENYTAGNFNGKSLNKYNSDTDKWEQFWIDNQGTTLKLEGGLIGSEMILSNYGLDSDIYTIQRITWTPHPDGSVQQVWEQIKTDNLDNLDSIFQGLDENIIDLTVLFDGTYVKK